MYAADHIVDIGPGAGVHGGEIVFQGSVDEALEKRAVGYGRVSVRTQAHSGAGNPAQGHRQKAHRQGRCGFTT